MLNLFLFLNFSTIFIFQTNAKIETFTLAANVVDTFVIPVFSSNSTLENFNDTLNFFFALPNLPNTFWFYAFGDIHPCSTELPYFCDISNYETQSSNKLNDPQFLGKVYENSVIENEHSCYVYLKLAYLLALKISPLCDNSTNCYIRRVNFIALTDYEKIESFYNFTETVLKQAFYFAFTTYPSNNVTDKYYYIYDNSTDLVIAEDIFGDEMCKYA
uniref:Uncharacterized protein n=1 Tax=Panagrolaimus sp. ES5 TaxID=591445 RepID=A0AC34FKD0_9BILA